MNELEILAGKLKNIKDGKIDNTLTTNLPENDNVIDPEKMVMQRELLSSVSDATGNQVTTRALNNGGVHKDTHPANSFLNLAVNPYNGGC